MNEPKKKQITYDQFRQTILGSATKQLTPEDQLKQARAQNILNLTVNPTRQDSVMYDRLHPGEKSIFPQPKGQEDILKEKTAQLNYNKSLLDYQSKQKEAESQNFDDVAKKRSEYYKKISEAQDILNKTVKTKKTDEEGFEFEDEKPAFDYKTRHSASKTVSAYSDSLRTLGMVEQLRNKGIKANIADVNEFFKGQEKNIDSVTKDMTKRGIPDRVAMIFKNTAIEVLRNGNSKEVAMQKAAEHVKNLFPQYFQ